MTKKIVICVKSVFSQDDLIRFPSDAVKKNVKICLAVDKSGSMTAVNDDDVKQFAKSLFNISASTTNAVLYGDPWFKQFVNVTRNVNGNWESKKVKNKRVIYSSNDFDELYEPSGATLCACLEFLEPADIFVFLGDGALTDPKTWPEIIANHIRKGTFKRASHMLFLFPKHTCDDEKKQFVDSMTEALRAAEIACHIIVKIVYTDYPQRYRGRFNPIMENLYDGSFENCESLLRMDDLIKEIVDKHTSFIDLPDDFTQISNIMAIKNSAPLREIARHLNSDIFDKLFATMVQMVKESPETLLKDKQWIKIHKLLSFSKALGYKDWLNEYKKNVDCSETRDILDTFYRLAFSDEDEVTRVFDSINKDHWIGSMISHVEMEKDTIVDYIRAKVGVMVLLQRIVPYASFVPVHVHFQGHQPADCNILQDVERGMPILDASVASSEDCRKMMKLMFLQWTTTSLSEELQFLCAMTCLTSDLVIDFRIVNMIKKAFFGDEEFLYTMLNNDDPLWYYIPIANMLWQVIGQYRDDMFPTIGKEKRIVDVFNKLHKITFYHTFLDTVYSKKTFVERTTRNLELGSIVLFSSWCDEPWPNIPPVGVVIFLDDKKPKCNGDGSKKSSKGYKFIVQYLDDIPWVKDLSLNLKDALTAGDIRKFKHSSSLQDNFTVLSSGQTVDVITDIDEHLMGLKKSGGVYEKRAVFQEDIRTSTLENVKSHLKQDDTRREVFRVSQSALQQIFNIPSTLWNLFARNEKMKAIVNGILTFEGVLSTTDVTRLIQFEGYATVDSNETRTRKTITLSSIEIRDILHTVEQDMSEKLVLTKGLKAFDIYPVETDTKDIVMCPVCLDTEKLVKMMIYPCGHSVCIECDTKLKEDARRARRDTFSCCECRQAIHVP